MNHGVPMGKAKDMFRSLFVEDCNDIYLQSRHYFAGICITHYLSISYQKTELIENIQRYALLDRKLDFNGLPQIASNISECFQ